MTAVNMSEASTENIEPLSWQVLDILASKVQGLVGEGAMSVLTTLENADRTQPPDPRIVYDLGNEMEELFGKKGAFALLRQAGREIGKNFTDGKKSDEAAEILASTLRQLGFAYEIKLEDNDAYICKCVFYKFLEADGHGPVQKPVCWTGWGFIEGCLSNVNGAHHVKWKSRDKEAQACRFSIRHSAEDYDK